MKNIAKALKERLHYIVYGIFLAIHAFNLIPVIRYGDDYYYSMFFRRGISYFLSETAVHYTQTNGRFFVHLLDEVLLYLPLAAWKVFEFFVIALTVLLVAEIASGNDRARFPSSLIMSCTAFSLIGLPILREAVYWATGSLNYVFPVMLTLLLFFAYSRLADEERGARYLPVLAFFASFTAEQSATASLFICIVMPIYIAAVKKKKLCTSYIVSIFTSAAAFATVMFSPGNSIRQTYYPEFYAKSLFGKIRGNLSEFFGIVFNVGVVFVFFLFFFTVAGYTFGKRFIEIVRKREGNIAYAVFCGASALSCSVSAVLLLARTKFFPRLTPSVAQLTISAVVSLAFCTIYFMISALRGESVVPFIFTAACVGVSGAMLISPVYGPRTLYITVIFLAVTTVYMLADLPDSVFKKSLVPLLAMSFAAVKCEMFSVKTVLCILVVTAIADATLTITKRKFRLSAVLAAAFSLMLFLSVGFGYFSNYEVNRFNENACASFVGEDQDGPLVLSYPVKSKYGWTLPFRDPYQAGKFKILYGIPEETEIVYKTPEELGIKSTIFSK